MLRGRALFLLMMEPSTQMRWDDRCGCGVVETGNDIESGFACDRFFTGDTVSGGSELALDHRQHAETVGCMRPQCAVEGEAAGQGRRERRGCDRSNFHM